MRGCPTCRFYAWGFGHAQRFETLPWARGSALPHVQLLSTAAVAWRHAGATSLRAGSRQDSRAVQILAGWIRGHAQSRAPAHQRNFESNTIGCSESVEAARLAGFPERQPLRACWATALGVYKKRRRSAAVLAAEVL